MARRPPTRTSSDPGPRYEEDEESDEGSDSSRATQNSDDEPLAGEPSKHVEAMLRACLAPDERTEAVHGDDGEDEDEGEEEQESGSEDYGHAEAIAAAYSGDEGGGGGGEEAESDLEELEEAHALRSHLLTIARGIHEVEEWSCSFDSDRPTDC